MELNMEALAINHSGDLITIPVKMMPIAMKDIIGHQRLPAKISNGKGFASNRKPLLPIQIPMISLHGPFLMPMV
jgi:hypothetical protein